MIKLTEKIAESLRMKDEIALKVYRAIKAERLKLETAAKAKPYTEEVEISLLSKMKKQREDSYNQYIAANRNDLANIELQEKNFIESLLPFNPSSEELDQEVSEYVTGCDGECTMKNIMQVFKSKYPAIDGKLLAQIVKKYV